MASGIVEPSQPGSEQSQQQQGRPAAVRTQLMQRLLSGASSLPNFIQDLIHQQARLVAGTEAAAFLMEAVPDQPNTYNLKPIAHLREDDSDEQTRTAALNAFAEIMQPCIKQGKDGAIQIDNTFDGSEWQYCLVTLLRNEGNIIAASAVITRARDLQRAQQRLELMQLVAGYFDMFAMRRSTEQTKSVAQSHQHVLQLATAVATADGFESAGMNLCNELAARTGAARVSMGWLKGDNIKLRAISHSEEFDKKQELSVQIVRVMEECLDNDEIVQYEPDGTTSETVTREAQALSVSQGGHTVLSLPLRRTGEVVGILTLEFAANQKIGPQAATGLAVAADLLAPQLYDRYQNDRWLITKVGLSLQDVYKKTFHTTQFMLAKTIAALILIVLLVTTFYRPMYHVSAPFQFVPTEDRSLDAPFDGRLAEVNVKPGDKVTAGQVLFVFDTTELQLKHTEYLSQAKEAEISMNANRADPSKAADMRVSEQRMLAAQAQADQVQYQIDHASVTAPFEGEILNGDLLDKRGATFKVGEPLMRMASRGNLEAKLFIEERDIQNVWKDQAGMLSTSAAPSQRFPFTVTRIVPAGTIKDAGNVFEVYATLNNGSGEWHPGMQGEARLDVRHEPMIWIWMHRFSDFVRIKLWI